MRERHLDGTVLMRQAAGGVFEPLARPDLLITDAERASVTTSRRKDRDAALIGISLLYPTLMYIHWMLSFRYYNGNSFIPFIPATTLRFKF